MSQSAEGPDKPHLLLRLLAIVIGLAGLPLAIGGVYLLSLGGSFYYMLAGAGLVATAVQLWSGRMSGVHIYLAVLALTLLWSLWEVGTAFWPSVPRLVAPIFLGACALLVVPLIRPHHGRPAHARLYAGGGAALAAVFVGFVALMFRPHGVIQNDFTVVPGEVSATTAASGDDWYSYGKTGEGARYAPFDQITPENVSQLEVA